MLRLAAVLALALAAPGSAAAAPAFPLGVAAGEVRASSAILWTSVARPGTVWAEVSADRRFRGMPSASPVYAKRTRTEAPGRGAVRNEPTGLSARPWRKRYQ